MNRRSFVGGLLAMLGLGAVAVAKPPKPKPRWTVETKTEPVTPYFGGCTAVFSGGTVCVNEIRLYRMGE